MCVQLIMENKSTCIKSRLGSKLFYTRSQSNSMDSDKNQEKKNLSEDKVSNQSEDTPDLLEGKTLHDLYRHTAKMIK